MFGLSSYVLLVSEGVPLDLALLIWLCCSNSHAAAKAVWPVRLNACGPECAELAETSKSAILQYR